MFDATGTHLAAYVNKQKARMLTKLLDAGTPIEATSLRGTRSGITSTRSPSSPQAQKSSGTYSARGRQVQRRQYSLHDLCAT